MFTMMRTNCMSVHSTRLKHKLWFAQTYSATIHSGGLEVLLVLLRLEAQGANHWAHITSLTQRTRRLQISSNSVHIWRAATISTRVLGEDRRAHGHDVNRWW